MPAEPPQANPFAPPEAPLWLPDSGASSDSRDLTEPYDGPDVTILFLRWESARLVYNGSVTLMAVGLWGFQIIDYPRNPTVALLVTAILVNLGFCIGPVVASVSPGGAGKSWSRSWAASLLCLGGMASTLIAIGLVLGVGQNRPA